jgi:PPOX class probable F420-dependent enzyme
MSCVADTQGFLAEANIAVLSTVDAQGRPHAAPVWYLYEGGDFLISTGRGSRKHRNIEANANISLTVDKRTLPYFAVMARGRAELGAGFSEEQRLRLAIRYLGERLGHAYVERTSAEDSVTIRLHGAKLIEYHGRAGR